MRPICRTLSELQHTETVLSVAVVEMRRVCRFRIVRRVAHLGPRLGSLTTQPNGRKSRRAENELLPPIILRLLAESKEAKNAVLTVPEPVTPPMDSNGFQMYPSRNGTWKSRRIVSGGDQRGAPREDVPAVHTPFRWYLGHSDPRQIGWESRGADCVGNRGDELSVRGPNAHWIHRRSSLECRAGLTGDGIDLDLQ